MRAGRENRKRARLDWRRRSASVEKRLRSVSDVRPSELEDLLFCASLTTVDFPKRALTLEDPHSSNWKASSVLSQVRLRLPDSKMSPPADAYEPQPGRGIDKPRCLAVAMKPSCRRLGTLAHQSLSMSHCLSSLAANLLIALRGECSDNAVVGTAA